jgi:hypothetical protein
LPKTLAHDLLMGEPKAMREAVNIVTGSLLLVDHYRSRHFSPEVSRFLIDSCERAIDQCATSIAAGALPAAAQALQALSDKWAQAKRELVGDAREV